jgi:predicted nucleic acid-binding protein
MQQRILVDTSAWLAVIDSSDAHHSKAARIYKRLLDEQTIFVVTILVIAETQIWLRRRLGAETAATFLQNVNESPRIEIVFPDGDLDKKAKLILRQFADQDFSLTDAISIAWLKENGLSEVFAFDRHFTTAGYTLVF